MQQNNEHFKASHMKLHAAIKAKQKPFSHQPLNRRSFFGKPLQAHLGN